MGEICVSSSSAELRHKFVWAIREKLSNFKSQGTTDTYNDDLGLDDEQDDRTVSTISSDGDSMSYDSMEESGHKNINDEMIHKPESPSNELSAAEHDNSGQSLGSIVDFSGTWILTEVDENMEPLLKTMG